MLDGVTPFPAEFAARYRALGYWEDRPLDEDGHVVPDGQPGDLIVRGPYTLRGYFRSPEHNARAFTPDGFYRSGDLLRKLPSGNYVVEGRVEDLINRGGEKISAEEVENLVLKHPAVLNVACVPYPDPVLGERMCACVVLRPGCSALSLEELVGFLRGFIQAWRAVDPLKGEAAVAEAIAAVRDHHVLGFHFHPIMGHFAVDDPALDPLFETIAGLAVPVMVDVGTTGMGAGLPGGLGARLEHARPLAIDNLAARFPALTIIAAHPGWP